MNFQYLQYLRMYIREYCFSSTQLLILEINILQSTLTRAADGLLVFRKWKIYVHLTE